MITVTCVVQEYPRVGDSYTTVPRTLLVENDPLDDNFVVLTIDKERIRISAKDLRAAIQNASNTAHF